MADLDKTVRAMLDAYRDAVLAKDPDRLLRLYDPAVRVFDTWGAWSYEGAAAWRIAVEGWLSSLVDERVHVSFDDVRTVGSEALASVTAIVTYAAVSDRGEPQRTMQNRLSWVLRTSGHVLRIVHEHTSAPVGFEDMRAILTRDAPTKPGGAA